MKQDLQYRKVDLLFFRQDSNSDHSGLIVLKDKESESNFPLFIEVLNENEFFILLDAIQNRKEYNMSKMECLRRIYSIHVSKDKNASIEYQIWRDNSSILNIKIENIQVINQLNEIDNLVLLNFNLTWKFTIEKAIYNYAFSVYERLNKSKNIPKDYLEDYLKYCLSVYRSQKYLSLQNVFYVESFWSWLERKEGVLV
ncbi:hypothetical protein [Heyndrickxia ginsengihumi]|uniref:hypothetical protein n=1 Tax=Heyndrickxia ginsengihumi TaxID=363870 RepID=UPI0004712CFD|nr:hypothetical protein [Heyndrickxia ginsengihumi]